MKTHHRVTEDTEDGVFSLTGSPAFQRDRPLAREKSFRLRRKLLSMAPSVDMKPPGYEIVPAGLRSFARSPSPDRARK